MRKRSIAIIPIVALFCLASALVVSADPGDGSGIARGPADASILGLITDDDVFSVTDLSALLTPPLVLGSTSNGTQHYGPYASSSPDSGTCDNDWAQDTFDRHFTVRDNRNGTFTVVEQFKNGSFVTEMGPSPGACETTDGSTTTFIRAGVAGSMHGYFVITVMGATTTSTAPACQLVAGCTTAGFIESHFPGATYSIGTYFFHYAAGDQGLTEHEWKNASEDRGGNHGDIAVY